MTAAALGTTVELQTLDGTEEIDVRPGTQSGEVMTLRGLGVAHLRGGRPRRPRRPPRRCSPRAGSTSSRRRCCASWPRLRGEERPAGRMAPAQGAGIFSKLRDRIAGR